MHALRHYKDESQWVAFLDVDEFLVLPEFDDIQEFLRRCPATWDCVYFNWSFFGNNGHLERPPGSVLTTYTRREDRVHQGTKTITRSAKIDLSRITHKVATSGMAGRVWWRRFRSVNVLGDRWTSSPARRGCSLCQGGQIQARIRSIGFVNHYAFKSVGDFDLRIQRGTLGEFSTQLNWQRVSDAGRAAATLQALNAIEDTYLADFWRRSCAMTVCTRSCRYRTCRMSHAASRRPRVRSRNGLAAPPRRTTPQAPSVAYHRRGAVSHRPGDDAMVDGRSRRTASRLRDPHL